MFILLPFVLASSWDGEMQLAKVMVKADLMLELMDAACYILEGTEHYELCLDQKYTDAKINYLQSKENYEFKFINYENFKEEWESKLKCKPVLDEWREFRGSSI